MPRSILFSSVLLASVISFGLSSCTNDEDAANVPGVRAGEVVTFNSGFLTDAQLHWTKDKVYHLNGKVVVPKNKKLVIDAGTKIYGIKQSSTIDASALIVPRDAQIEAVGNADDPIVFDALSGQKGDWGGIVIEGNAPINQPTKQYVEGIDEKNLPEALKDADFSYGGTNPHDNSGKLSYIRILNAGASIAPNNELNSLTLAAVGDSTKIDHIFTYRGADDGIELFGGTVPIKYFVCYGTDDDGLDMDFGYSGKVQFVVIKEDPNFTYSSDPNAIECDNENPFNAAHTPYTHPVLSNFTIIGTQDGNYGTTPFKSAANFRRGTQFTLRNSVIYGFPKGLYFTDEPSDQLAKSEFSYSVISSVPAGNEIVGGTVPGNGVDIVANASEIGLINPWGAYQTDLVPLSGSKAASGANFIGLDTKFFEVVSYKGAIDPDSRDSWTNEKWAK